ncbi:MAG: chemotaxis protein CheB, partial [Candidatus Latescibacteria bacterium]|nr:chemotaxis protein CheB [Candidatus Latescibacterota bacterium]
LIVQHIANGFIDGLASWLGQSTGFAVHIAQDRESLRPGHAYLAPDEFQMGVGYKHQILLSTDQPEYGTRPSVSYLFRSVTQIFGEQVIGVILTGMGRDGSLELGHMQASGATTIAQDEESAIVHGMAGEAIRLNAATCVRPLDQIATTLEDLVNNNARYDI